MKFLHLPSTTSANYNSRSDYSRSEVLPNSPETWEFESEQFMTDLPTNKDNLTTRDIATGEQGRSLLHLRRRSDRFASKNLRGCGLQGRRASSSSSAEIGLVHSLQSQGSDSLKKCKYLSSYEVFIKFAPMGDSGSSTILSKECFDTWVNTRRHGVKNAEHSFRKALIAHLCGKDGRRPFPPALEPLVVSEIRKKSVWPCFVDSADARVINIGNKGFRHLAFHENKNSLSQTTPRVSKLKKSCRGSKRKPKTNSVPLNTKKIKVETTDLKFPTTKIEPSAFTYQLPTPLCENPQPNWDLNYPQHNFYQNQTDIRQPKSFVPMQAMYDPLDDFLSLFESEAQLRY